MLGYGYSLGFRLQGLRFRVRGWLFWYAGLISSHGPAQSVKKQIATHEFSRIQPGKNNQKTHQTKIKKNQKKSKNQKTSKSIKIHQNPSKSMKMFEKYDFDKF
jgi:hypothetical protein